MKYGPFDYTDADFGITAADFAGEGDPTEPTAEDLAPTDRVTYPTASADTAELFSDLDPFTD